MRFRNIMKAIRKECLVQEEELKLNHINVRSFSLNNKIALNNYNVLVNGKIVFMRRTK